MPGAIVPGAIVPGVLVPGANMPGVIAPTLNDTCHFACDERPAAGGTSRGLLGACLRGCAKEAA